MTNNDKERMKLIQYRQVCPFRAAVAAIDNKSAECLHEACALWTSKGVCAVKAIAEKK